MEKHRSDYGKGFIEGWGLMTTLILANAIATVLRPEAINFMAVVIADLVAVVPAYYWLNYKNRKRKQ